MTPPPAENRRRTILEAALRVMATEGIAGASIKRIAREAGLASPSLIYHYFRDKDALADAVVSELSPLVQETRDPAALMALPPEVALPRLMHAYYATLDAPYGRELLRIFFGEAIRTPDLASGHAAGQRAVVAFLSGYLAHQVEAGRLRPHDVESGARIFLGSMFAFVLTTELMPHLGEGMPERETYVREAIAVFLRGLASP
ncbi:TetR/AcrR family transcriptional regulator [soil metagenome]|nr:TetR/AcrR family transcriptional regulator [Trueperaceae bacterium]